MASFEIRRRIKASSAYLYHCAHYEANAWDPLGQRMQCIQDGVAVLPGNRVKINPWHGQAMVVEYIQLQAPERSAMKMVMGPHYLKSFAGSWRFVPIANGQTLACWRYQIRAAAGFRLFERLFLLYFKWETRRRLAALAAYCEQQGVAT